MDLVISDGAGTDDIVIIVFDDGIYSAMGVMGHSTVYDLVMGGLLQFDGIAVMGEGTVADGVVAAGGVAGG